MDETCKWQRVKDLVWQTECNHQIGTPKSWEPVPGMSCFCCRKPIEIQREHDYAQNKTNRCEAS